MLNRTVGVSKRFALLQWDKNIFKNSDLHPEAAPSGGAGQQVLEEADATQEASGWLFRRNVSLAAPHAVADSEGMEWRFGRKHYGRPLHQVVAEDPSYCQWVIKRAKEGHASATLHEHAAWLRQHAPQLTTRQTDGTSLQAKDSRCTSHMERKASSTGCAPTFHGKNLSQMAANDPVFCQWILREAQGPRASNHLLEASSWLSENAPHLKAEGMFAAGRKHRGRPLSEVVVDDPAYCQWVLREAQEKHATPELRAMATWLAKYAPHVKDAGVFATGPQHEGRPIAELVSEDPTYCQWILRVAEEEKEEATKGLQEQAAWLLKNAPHLKEMPLVALRGSHRGIPLPQVVVEDPGWCHWVMMQPQAYSTYFADASDWLRENVPELLEAQEDDEATITKICQPLLEAHGKHFVIRFGKYRMKTFETMMEEAPKFVNWAKRMSDYGRASRNIHLLAAFARQQEGAPASGLAMTRAQLTAEHLTA
ncbi:unnamed protein product [Symbiodinium pilosum]|uniref:Uncharacterized protein n=1 Tax=Symbiodinium pilosum TaxID=2952 RepID=A0A812T9X7_SYMPI|nr:unnamed protein product [Symbiodinium pilosum]